MLLFDDNKRYTDIGCLNKFEYFFKAIVFFKTIWNLDWYKPIYSVINEISQMRTKFNITDGLFQFEIPINKTIAAC